MYRTITHSVKSWARLGMLCSLQGIWYTEKDVAHFFSSKRHQVRQEAPQKVKIPSSIIHILQTNMLAFSMWLVATHYNKLAVHRHA